MKVYINKYKDHWISPYTMIDYVFFWKDWSKCSRWPLEKTLEDDARKLKGEKSLYIERPDWVEIWADRLTPISKAIQKTMDFVRPRVVDVKIDYWDTWSMDSTLAPIILPMLKQLRETKHGSPMVDMEDVPEYMRTTTTEDYDSQKVFDFYNQDVPEGYDVHKRWDWILDEMIFAFEHLIDDSWEEKYRSGEMDHYHEPCKWDENGKPTLYQMKEGPNHTYICDYDGMKVVQERIQNGFRLFGKYYTSLWD